MLIATTTLTVTRPTTDGTDPYETAATTNAYAGVSGHVSAPSGTDRNIGGDLEIVDAVAYLPAGTLLEHEDRIVDDATGDEYTVVWSRARPRPRP